MCWIKQALAELCYSVSASLATRCRQSWPKADPIAHAYSLTRMAAKGAVKAQASDMAKKVGGEKLKEATADPARSHHFVGKTHTQKNAGKHGKINGQTFNT